MLRFWGISNSRIFFRLDWTRFGYCFISQIFEVFVLDPCLDLIVCDTLSCVWLLPEFRKKVLPSTWSKSKAHYAWRSVIRSSLLLNRRSNLCPDCHVTVLTGTVITVLGSPLRREDRHLSKGSSLSTEPSWKTDRIFRVNRNLSTKSAWCDA